jgi:hypothetical protein
VTQIEQPIHLTLLPSHTPRQVGFTHASPADGLVQRILASASAGNTNRPRPLGTGFRPWNLAALLNVLR